MRFYVALPLALLAQAVSASAIPNPLVTTLSAENVSSLTMSPAPMHDANHLNRRSKTYPRAISIELRKYWTPDYLQRNRVNFHWLFSETTVGENVNCKGLKNRKSRITDWDSRIPSDEIATLDDAKGPIGDTKLENLYADGKMKEDACKYKNDPKDGNAGAIFCGNDLLSTCKLMVSKGNYKWTTCNNDNNDKRVQWVRSSRVHSASRLCQCAAC
jgi:hypothetical protein